MTTSQSLSINYSRNSKLNDFEFISIVNSGTYGEVSKYRDKRDNQIKAIKKIFDRNLSAVNEMRTKGDDLMRKLKHDHIAEYYGYFFDDENHLRFVMKFYEGGNLEDHLKKKLEMNLKLDDETIVNWSLQLLDAIYYTMNRKIIHNDLKPANILLSDDKSSIVVTDFGLAVEWDKNRSHASFNGGTPLYLAPEALDNDKVYPKSDLWSCAVIIYELIHLMRPFKTYREVGTKINIYFCQSNICDKFRNLIQRILQTNIDDRPEIIDAIYYLKLHKFTLFNIIKHLDDSQMATRNTDDQNAKLAISPIKDDAAVYSSKNDDDKQLNLITLVLKDEDTIESQIMSFSAHLDSSSISVSLIADFIKFSNPSKADDQINEEAVKRIIIELDKSGFISKQTVDENGRHIIKIDDKIKEIILTQLRILLKKQKIEEKVLEYLDERTPYVNNNSPREDSEKLKAIYNHLVEIGSKVKLENEQMAKILFKIGKFNYNIRNDYKKAIDYYEKSLAMRQRIHKNADHPDIADSLNNIGTTYHSLGEFKKAIDFYERSLAMRQRIHKNADHPDIALSLNNIGTTYHSLGEFKKAIDYKERSLAMRQRIHNNADHSDIAQSLNNIGYTYDDLKDYKKAIDFYERSLAMRQRIHKNADHPDIADSLNNIGVTYDNLKDYKKAIDYKERSLAMYQRIHNNADHPDIADSLNNIGYTYDNLKDYKKAIDFYERSLAMRQRIHNNADHSDIAQSLNNIGVTYDNLKDYKKAIDYYQRALRMYRVFFDSNHSQIQFLQKRIPELRKLI